MSFDQAFTREQAPKETPLDDWRAWEVVEKIGQAMMEVEKR